MELFSPELLNRNSLQLEQQQVLQLNKVRTVIDPTTGEVCYSIVDFIKAVGASSDPADYWSTQKRRINKEETNVRHIFDCRSFKMRAKDGKMRETDCATLENLLFLKSYLLKKQNLAREQQVITNYRASNPDWLFVDCQNKGKGIPDYCLIKNGDCKWIEFKYNNQLKFNFAMLNSQQIITIDDMLNNGLNIAIVIGNQKKYIEIDKEQLKINIKELKENLAWRKQQELIEKEFNLKPDLWLAAEQGTC